jgi:hypothetical protein
MVRLVASRSYLSLLLLGCSRGSTHVGFPMRMQGGHVAQVVRPTRALVLGGMRDARHGVCVQTRHPIRTSRC